jgi:hypothetical protein
MGNVKFKRERPFDMVRWQQSADVYVVKGMNGERKSGADV